MAIEYKTLNREELLQSLEECDSLLSMLDIKMEIVCGSVPELEGNEGFYKSTRMLNNITELLTKITELRNLIKHKEYE